MFLVVELKMNMEHLWNSKNVWCSEKNMFWCHFIQHKSHVDYSDRKTSG